MVDYINAQQKMGGLCSAEWTRDRKAPTLKGVVLEIFV